MKNYIEIREIIDKDSQEIPQLIRLDCVDESEAEELYAFHKSKIKNHEAVFVKEYHAVKEGDENKPCESFKIEDGKVVK